MSAVTYQTKHGCVLCTIRCNTHSQPNRPSICISVVCTKQPRPCVDPAGLPDVDGVGPSAEALDGAIAAPVAFAKRKRTSAGSTRRTPPPGLRQHMHEPASCNSSSVTQKTRAAVRGAASFPHDNGRERCYVSYAFRQLSERSRHYGTNSPPREPWKPCEPTETLYDQGSRYALHAVRLVRVA
jgi:hypothetical protein